jgi:hypothetical protein
MSRPQLSETSHHEKVFPVSPEWARRSWVDESKYQAWYEKAVAEPAAFWSEHAGRIDWFKPFTKVKNTSFGPARGDQAAIIWEGTEPAQNSLSGKIMRRILRKIAENEFGNLGDTSTLADPAVVDDLISSRQNLSRQGRKE